MGFIPLPPNPDDPRSAGVPQARGNARDFGAGVGEAMIQAASVKGAAIQQLAGEITRFGGTITSIGKQKAAETDALGVANALSSKTYTPTANDIMLNHPAEDGAGMADAVGGQSWDDYAEGIRAEARKNGVSSKGMLDLDIKLAGQKRTYVEGAVDQQAKTKAAYDVRSSQAGLNRLMDDILLHGATDKVSFQRTTYAADEIIESQTGRTKEAREAAKILWHNQAAAARFDKLRDAAKTPAEIQALKAEMAEPFWAKELDPSDVQKEQDQQAASASRWAELGIGTTADKAVNNIAAGKDYTVELKAAIDETLKIPTDDPAKQQAHILDLRSKAAAARFEYKLENLPTDQKAAIAKIAELRKEASDSKWSDEFSKEDYKQTLDSFTRHENAIDQNIKSTQTKLEASERKVYNLQESQLKADVGDAIHAVNEGKPLSDAQWQALRNAHVALQVRANHLAETSGEPTDAVLDPELMSNIERVFHMDAQYRESQGLKPRDLKAQKEAVQRSGAKVTTDENGKKVVISSGNWQAGLQRINASRFGQAAITNLDPVLGQRLNELYEAAPESVKKLMLIRSGWRDPNDPKMAAAHRRNPKYVANPKSSFHGKGDAADLGFRGYAFGKAPPEAIKWLHDHAGEHGLAFPLDGSGNLPNEPWHIETIENRRGGGGRSASAGRPGGGGRSGGFYGALSGFEASGANAPHSYTTTSSGMARGYFQITDDTWKDFGGLATGYKTAYDAPYEIQKQIADKIPMNRWAPETLNKMQKAGWTIYPTKTLAENAALNGDDGSGGAPTGTGGGDAGAAASLDSGLRPSFESNNRADALDKMITTSENGLKASPITQGGVDGIINPTSLLTGGEDAWGQRVKDYQTVDEYYDKLAPANRKPFTTEEIAAYDNIMAGNDNSAKLAVYQQIAKWPEAMRQDAYNQLATKNPAAGIIGQLSPDDAQTAMQGDNILKGLEAGKGTGATWQSDANKAFNDSMGGSITGMDPNEIEGRKRVYDSMYAAKFGPYGELDPQQYEKIIEHVENVTFGTVNGIRSMNPKDITGRVMEAALPAIDYTAVSLFKTEARVWNAQHTELIPPSDVDKSLWQPKRIAPGLYMFTNSRGEIVSTITNEGPRAYVAKLDGPTITMAAARANQIITDRSREAGTRMGAGPIAPTAYDFSRLAIDPSLVPDLPKTVYPTDVPSLTPGVPGEAPGKPTSNVNQPMPAKATEVPATRAIEPERITRTELTQEEKRLLETSVELYSQSLKAAGRSKEYVDQAIKNYREYYMNRADILRRAAVLMRMQQGAPQ